MRLCLGSAGLFVTMMGLTNGGCGNPLTAGMTDWLGGVRVERALLTADGDHVLIATRYAEGQTRRGQWFVYRLGDGHTWRLAHDRGVAARTIDADVWPSPTTPELALREGDAIHIVDLATGRVTDSLDASAAATAALSAQAPRHGKLADLYRELPDWEIGRRFWAAYLARRDGTSPQAVVSPPVLADLDTLDTPPANFIGQLSDRHGTAAGMTNLHVGNSPRLSSHASQVGRNVLWAAKLPVDIAVVGWQVVQQGLAVPISAGAATRR